MQKAYIKYINNITHLFIKLSPNAIDNKIDGFVLNEHNQQYLKVYVKQIAENNKANKELVKFIAEITGISKSDIKLIKGDKSRYKVLEINSINIKI